MCLLSKSWHGHPGHVFQTRARWAGYRSRNQSNTTTPGERPSVSWPWNFCGLPCRPVAHVHGPLTQDRSRSQRKCLLPEAYSKSQDARATTKTSVHALFAARSRGSDNIYRRKVRVLARLTGVMPLMVGREKRDAFSDSFTSLSTGRRRSRSMWNFSCGQSRAMLVGTCT
jgi:hypothetical protein